MLRMLAIQNHEQDTGTLGPPGLLRLSVSCYLLCGSIVPMFLHVLAPSSFWMSLRLCP